ncbi:unnamed protein product [Cyprideis torosa]|uniref:Uncharacterized protein n=1 Tax=Cyprideis torosa TaxID=163714 RepID=A0A7R8W4Y0_9CRUS|nr:unnamed protein product [Cyprideis torosa]CAG0879980.1 unnamed protein product [Cyprideis torosa]
MAAEAQPIRVTLFMNGSRKNPRLLALRPNNSIADVLAAAGAVLGCVATKLFTEHGAVIWAPGLIQNNDIVYVACDKEEEFMAQSVQTAAESFSGTLLQELVDEVRAIRIRNEEAAVKMDGIQEEVRVIREQLPELLLACKNDIVKGVESAGEAFKGILKIMETLDEKFHSERACNSARSSSQGYVSSTEDSLNGGATSSETVPANSPSPAMAAMMMAASSEQAGRVPQPNLIQSAALGDTSTSTHPILGPGARNLVADFDISIMEQNLKGILDLHKHAPPNAAAINHPRNEFERAAMYRMREQGSFMQPSGAARAMVDRSRSEHYANDSGAADLASLYRRRMMQGSGDLPSGHHQLQSGEWQQPPPY